MQKPEHEKLSRIPVFNLWKEPCPHTHHVHTGLHRSHRHRYPHTASALHTFITIHMLGLPRKEITLRVTPILRPVVCDKSLCCSDKDLEAFSEKSTSEERNCQIFRHTTKPLPIRARYPCAQKGSSWCSVWRGRTWCTKLLS
jgi:hypothetical protein